MGDDARRQGDLRRADRPPGARRGVPRPGAEQPDLPADLQRPGRLAGVHGDGEAVRAAHRRRLRPARPRHAPDPQRPRLPRRAETADPVHRGQIAAGLHEADRAGGEGRPAAASRSPSASSRNSSASTCSPTWPSSSTPSAAWSTASRPGPSASTSSSPIPETCFLVVCGPQGEPIDEAVYFHRKLVEAKLPFGGVVVNKVHYPADELEAEVDDLPATWPRSWATPTSPSASPPTSPTTRPWPSATPATSTTSPMSSAPAA